MEFEGWYAQEHARLIGSLLLITGDLDLAADGVDEGFARALEHWDRVGTMGSPTGWVFKVALNHARRVARRRGMERRLLFHP
ncbi:MAG TPA: sigma factor, partial [Acidimicrobiales bacterium]